MFIIKWVNVNKKQVFYTYTRCLSGAHTDTPPYVCEQYIGYVNYNGHEILDINYVYHNKVWSYEDYKKNICFNQPKKIKTIILDNIISFLNKLNKQ